MTSSDVERLTSEAKSRRKPARDAQFRLVVGAALAPVRKPSGELDRDKILAHVGSLVEENIDAVAVSTAHGPAMTVNTSLPIAARPTWTTVSAGKWRRSASGLPLTGYTRRTAGHRDCTRSASSRVPPSATRSTRESPI